MHDVSDSGDGEQLLHGDGAVCRRRPDGQDLREEEARGEGGAALHPADPLRGGTPAQTRRRSQVTAQTRCTAQQKHLTRERLIKKKSGDRLRFVS